MHHSTRNNLVAVYGTLKRRYPNHFLLHDSEFLGLDRVHGFVLYDLGLFPGARVEAAAEVGVEVFAVSVETLQLLDELEGYRPEDPASSYFMRTLFPSHFGGVWLYTFNNSVEGLDIVASGSW